jgi:hypothetical protein
VGLCSKQLGSYDPMKLYSVNHKRRQSKGNGGDYVTNATLHSSLHLDGGPRGTMLVHTNIGSVTSHNDRPAPDEYRIGHKQQPTVGTHPCIQRHDPEITRVPTHPFGELTWLDNSLCSCTARDGQEWRAFRDLDLSQSRCIGSGVLDANGLAIC